VRRDFLVAQAKGPEPQGLAHEFLSFLFTHADTRRTSLESGKAPSDKAHKLRK
jgi:hypothetical protein